jgi:hypothetical protein
MICKSSSQTPGCVCITFQLPASLKARRIFVVGSFNDWNITATPLQRDEEGTWRARIDLPNGQTYEFRYWIDGQWWADRQADGLMPSVCGDYNAIVDLHRPSELPFLHLQDDRISAG